jgi:hypothetical protein
LAATRTSEERLEEPKRHSWSRRGKVAPTLRSSSSLMVLTPISSAARAVPRWRWLRLATRGGGSANCRPGGPCLPLRWEHGPVRRGHALRRGASRARPSPTGPTRARLVGCRIRANNCPWLTKPPKALTLRAVDPCSSCQTTNLIACPGAQTDSHSACAMGRPLQECLARTADRSSEGPPQTVARFVMCFE